MRSPIAIIALLVASPAAAITIDFNDLIGDPFFFSPGSSYDSQGYRFSNNVQEPAALFAWGRAGNGIVYNADANPATGTTLVTNYGNSVTTVSRIDGAAFTLSSLFVADIYNGGSPGLGTPVRYSFTTSTGTTSEIRNLDQIRGLQLETFNRGGLLAFSIAPQQYQPLFQFPSAGFVQIDNVGLLLDTGGAAGGVPEPESWAMLIIGLGLTGAALRRRGHRAIAA